MSEINFFTPIYYGAHANSTKEKALQNIDNYFYICGKKAVVIPGRTDDGKEKVMLQSTKFSIGAMLKTIGIALSIFTVIIPFIMLISKAALRSSHSYKIMDPKKELEKGNNVGHLSPFKNEPKNEEGNDVGLTPLRLKVLRLVWNDNRKRKKRAEKRSQYKTC